MKPYFDDGVVTLYHGDAREVLPALFRAGVVADLLIADPPYAISKKGSKARGPKKDRNRDFLDTDYDVDATRALCVDAAALSGLMLAPHASVYWWTGHAVFGELEHYYRARKWETRPACWWKPNAPPPMPECFPGGIELLFHAYREGRTWNNLAQHAHFAERKLDRELITDHPNEKPLAVIGPLVEWSTKPGALVLDPFAGSGSTLVAARALDRRAIGIELKERWCELAARRLSQAILPGVAGGAA